MIKLLLTGTTLIAACATMQVNAQIQNMNPMAGDEFTYSYYDLTVADSGSVGVNQTWDFSDAVSVQQTLTKTYRALTAQEQTDFPTANLAYTEDSDPTVYLLNTSADSLTDLGATDFLYTNPVVLYKYPISNTYNFTDNAAVTGVPMFGFEGTIRTFYQGTGTLVTPFGMYENVMKIRRKGMINLSLSGSSDQVLMDAFVWINADNNTELMSIESSDYVNNMEEDEVYAYFLENGAFASIGKIEKQVFSLYPNPANEVVFLKSASETPISYQIYSIAGALVQAADYSPNQGIATGNLQTGEYILQATTTTGTVSHVKFSKI